MWIVCVRMGLYLNWFKSYDSKWGYIFLDLATHEMINSHFSTIYSQFSAIYINIVHKTEVQTVFLRCWTVWQYGLWSFQTGGTKLKRFLPKSQHSLRKLLNFENWVDGKASKIGHHFRYKTGRVSTRDFTVCIKIGRVEMILILSKSPLAFLPSAHLT